MSVQAEKTLSEIEVGDDVIVRDFNFDDVRLRAADRLAVPRLTLYFIYSLMVVTTGILLLVNVAPVFANLALVFAALSLFTIYYKIFVTPDPEYRVHYQYCFQTLCGAVWGAIIAFALLLGNYWLRVRGHDSVLSAAQTSLFNAHGYLFWIFLPPFIYTVLRVFKGWTNIKTRRQPEFRSMPHLPVGWPRTKRFITSYLLLLAGFMTLFAVLWLTKFSSFSILTLLFALCFFSLVAAGPEEYRKASYHVLTTVAGFVGTLLATAVLISFGKSTAHTLTFLFATKAESDAAFLSVQSVYEWLDMADFYLILALPLAFMLYRLLDILGLLLNTDRNAVPQT